MGSAVIFSGNDVKSLKANLDLNGQSKILSGTVDPSSVATVGNPGSIYLNSSTGVVYRKTDSGSSTNWVQMAAPAFAQGAVVFGSGGTTTAVDATNFFWDDTNNRLGLGMSSPGARLDVTATNIAVPAVSARYNSTNIRMSMNLANSNGFPYLAVNANPTTGSDTATFDLNGYAARLRLDNGIVQLDRSSASGTAGNNITWSNSMYIDTAGNVGIGMTPTNLLDVNGVVGAGRFLPVLGGALSTGISLRATEGLSIRGGTGSTSDFTLFNGAASTVFENLTGTVDLSFKGKLLATNIHNNGGTGNASNQAVTSGTYTPTSSGLSASLTSVTVSVLNWSRTGNVVTVGGRVTFNANATTEAVFALTLPVASAFTGDEQGGGAGAFPTTSGATATNFHPVSVTANSSLDKMYFVFVPTQTGANKVITFSFIYVVV